MNLAFCPSDQRINWRRGAAVAALLCFAIGAMAGVDGFDAAHEALIADKSFDFTYGEVQSVERAPRTNNGSLDAFFKALGRIVMWIAISIFAVIAAYIIFNIAREVIRVRGIRFAKKGVIEDIPEPAYQPEAKAAHIVLDEVDALAAQGRYSEAVHALLLRTIQDLRRNRPRSVPDALTSREISTLDILSANARLGFSNISGRVERSYFGGSALDQADFEKSRQDYANFAFERPDKRRARSASEVLT